MRSYPYEKLEAAVEKARTLFTPDEAAAFGAYEVNGDSLEDYGVVSHSYGGKRFSVLDPREVHELSVADLGKRIAEDWRRWLANHPLECRLIHIPSPGPGREVDAVVYCEVAFIRADHLAGFKAGERLERKFEGGCEKFRIAEMPSIQVLPDSSEVIWSIPIIREP